MGSKLFESLQFGNLSLKNRVVMAPMTRSRALGNVPNALMATYYGQRSDAGLMITEGTSPSANGLGYARIPGLFEKEHVAGWRLVTSAAHQGASRIFVQLMHTGRVSHKLNMPGGAKILAPSAVPLTGTMWTDQMGLLPYETPHEMTETEILLALEEFAASARMAVEAGFDGVEIHGANGYLIDQFLNTASNRRRDCWGGSLENRLRFPLEVVNAITKAIGPGRVGMRISPFGVFNDMRPDAEMTELYQELARRLSSRGLLYLHVVNHSSMGAPELPASLQHSLRQSFRGFYILSGGYDRARAEQELAEGKGDLVAFGRPFISNPRLVATWKKGDALRAPQPETFYTPGPVGYTDYP